MVTVDLHSNHTMPNPKGRTSVSIAESDRILLKQHSRGVPLYRLMGALIHAYVENPSIVDSYLNAASRAEVAKSKTIQLPVSKGAA